MLYIRVECIHSRQGSNINVYVLLKANAPTGKKNAMFFSSHFHGKTQGFTFFHVSRFHLAMYYICLVAHVVDRITVSTILKLDEYNGDGTDVHLLFMCLCSGAGESRVVYVAVVAVVVHRYIYG